MTIRFIFKYYSPWLLICFLEVCANVISALTLPESFYVAGTAGAKHTKLTAAVRMGSRNIVKVFDSPLAPPSSLRSPSAAKCFSHQLMTEIILLVGHHIFDSRVFIFLIET